MKKAVLVLGVVFQLIGCASAQQKSNEINQKLDSNANREIVLVKVSNDSRCPEGVQCIWAGEVTIEVAAYQDKKIVEQTQFTLNRNTMGEVTQWFVKHLPPKKEELKGVSVYPYPKEGVVIAPQEYKIKLEY